MSKTLIVIFGETRSSELTFNSFKSNVFDVLNGDLCVCIGVKPDYDYNNPFYQLAKYRFTYQEPDDYSSAFEYAYNEICKDRKKYEQFKDKNAFFAKISNLDESSETIKYYGKYGSELDTELFNDDVLVHHEDNFSKINVKNRLYGSNKINIDNLVEEKNVSTYKKHLHWREFLKIKDQFLGGIKDPHNEHPGSAGILIFFRWYLLKNLIEQNLINEYDRFIITRSDYIYQLPHPKLDYLDEKNIWIPDCEHYGGYTDRHVILSKSNLIPYLNILNNMVLRSNEYFNSMKSYRSWNLERFIKFHLEKSEVNHLVKFFPYVMYAVRNRGGSTRWSQGVWNDNLGYYVKYQSELNKSTEYKNNFLSFEQNIDEFYKVMINKVNKIIE